ncbi:hypothetical protein D3C72_2110720 [compost metagenome]
MAAHILNGFGDLAGGRRDGRGAVDDGGAALKTLQHAVLLEENLFHLGRSRHAENQDVDLRGQIRCLATGACPASKQVIQRLVARMFQHGQRKAVAQEAGAYARAHHAGADQADTRLIFCHGECS